MGDRMQFEYFVTIMGETFDLKVDADANGAIIKIGDNSYQIEGAYQPGAGVQTFQVNGKPMCFRIQQQKDQLVLSRHGREVRTRAMNRREHGLYGLMPEKTLADTSSMVISPMPGKVLAVYVKAGDKLEAGAEVCVLEAMKMENVLYAEKACVVQEVLVANGDTVQADQLLIQLEVSVGEAK